MKMARLSCMIFLVLGTNVAAAQVAQVEPRVLTKNESEGKVGVVQVAPRFVTTIRLPETVNSVVVGDPSDFQVEHSDHEPTLVFVKALTDKPAETNLLISTASGRQVSLLLVSRGKGTPDSATIDFLVRYEPPSGFFVNPSGFPSTLVGGTLPLTSSPQSTSPRSPTLVTAATRSVVPLPSPITTLAASLGSVHNDAPVAALDQLLEREENAPLPVMYGEHIAIESTSGDHVRAGVSQVIDEGEQVIVLFSVINPTKHAILIMPPQVQLGGKTKSGKIIHHEKWSTAEQLPIADFRLNRRRLGVGERADGVVVFVRPPYKQSSETLFLQVAESGAVDRPALAPIGFGVSSSVEERNGRGN